MPQPTFEWAGTPGESDIVGHFPEGDYTYLYSGPGETWITFGDFHTGGIDPNEAGHPRTFTLDIYTRDTLSYRGNFPGDGSLAVVFTANSLVDAVVAAVTTHAPPVITAIGVLVIAVWIYRKAWQKFNATRDAADPWAGYTMDDHRRDMARHHRQAKGKYIRRQHAERKKAGDISGSRSRRNARRRLKTI